MVLYLVKVNNVYYGKENTINGRIIDPSLYIDRHFLAMTVKEIAYKTKQGAIKAAQKIKEKEKGADVRIQGLIFKN